MTQIKSKRKKEKSLKPSMREKKRYLLLGKASKEKIEKIILDYVGILGYGKAGVVFVKNNVLAVNRKQVEKVKSALLLGGVAVRKVSGSLRGLKN